MECYFFPFHQRVCSTALSLIKAEFVREVQQPLFLGTPPVSPRRLPRLPGPRLLVPQRPGNAPRSLDEGAEVVSKRPRVVPKSLHSLWAFVDEKLVEEACLV